MRILVLGSGLLGVSTAYELARRGFSVTVLDRQPASAAEGSYSNGAQLSYSHAEPWASPHILPKLPIWILDPSAPLVFRPRADWQMMKWGVRFLRNCTTARAHANCINILRLGLHSRQELARIRAETGIAFDFSNRGILRIYSDQAELNHARKQSEFQAKFGCQERVLTRDECVALEPVLQHTTRTIVGGLHAFQDEVGDAHHYCTELAKYAESEHGVQFRYGISIASLRTEHNKVVAVTTNQGDIEADSFVMAMGAYSAPCLRTIGLDIPVYPMKGYSITIAANDFAPHASITDGKYKIVYTRIGDKLRVAGTAEFTGYSQEVNPKRIAPILKAAKKFLPKIDWSQPVESWACLRPSTPDGPPILGRTPYHNLFLNTGHGTLGWTQAAGSASIVADIMENKVPPILLEGLTLR